MQTAGTVASSADSMQARKGQLASTCFFCGGRATGHPVRFSSPNATSGGLSKPTFRNATGTVIPCGLQGPLEIPSYSSAPPGFQPRAWKRERANPKVCEWELMGEDTLLLETLSPGPRPYPSRPTQREGKHHWELQFKSHEVQIALLAGESRGSETDRTKHACARWAAGTRGGTDACVRRLFLNSLLGVVVFFPSPSSASHLSLIQLAPRAERGFAWKKRGSSLPISSVF